MPDEQQKAIIDNRTGLPDEVVMEAAKTYFVETASMAGVQMSTFQSYAAEGSLLARRKFETPGNVFDEIRLARDLAERDDDVAPTMGALIATAFGEGMQHHHEDERSVKVQNKLARHARLDNRLKEMYREYLIAGSVTTVSLFVREQVEWIREQTGRVVKESVAAPLIGVLHAEDIRVIDSDLFGTGRLAYRPHEDRLREWLEEYFGDRTTAARKAEMRRKDRVAAAMFTGKVKVDFNDLDLFSQGMDLYLLNPRMVHRTTMPKGEWKYPRPPLTRNFALLEAKRLLNIMDYALLQGGASFIVVAKKGSDQKPAIQEEVDNLQEVVRTASQTGVIVGDHRLSFEIITPDLTALLNGEKRRLVGNKLARALLRLPDIAESDDEGVSDLDIELVTKVITDDRTDIRRHVENFIYEESARRNSRIFRKGAPSIWFPKIVLAGTNYFTDYVLKLRDRGDIPRQWAVEAAGFDYEAAVQQRERELRAGHDDILIPGMVPHSSPEAGPQDNNEGRPRGTSRANGRNPSERRPGDRARPTRRILRTQGETVRAIVEEDETGAEQEPVRVGELTYAILAEYADTKTEGRVTPLELRALEARTPVMEGPLAIVPVNPGYECDDVRAVRLTTGLSMLVGARRGDRALVAKALCFRQPEFDVVDAEEYALRWGFALDAPVEQAEIDVDPDPEPEPAPQLPTPEPQRVELAITVEAPQPGPTPPVPEPGPEE